MVDSSGTIALYLTALASAEGEPIEEPCIVTSKTGMCLALPLRMNIPGGLAHFRLHRAYIGCLPISRIHNFATERYAELASIHGPTISQIDAAFADRSSYRIYRPEIWLKPGSQTITVKMMGYVFPGIEVTMELHLDQEPDRKRLFKFVTDPIR